MRHFKWLSLITGTILLRSLSLFWLCDSSGQILHTDVVYLHGSGRNREADKLCHLMLKHRYYNSKDVSPLLLFFLLYSYLHSLGEVHELFHSLFLLMWTFVGVISKVRNRLRGSSCSSNSIVVMNVKSFQKVRTLNKHCCVEVLGTHCHYYLMLLVLLPVLCASGKKDCVIFSQTTWIK